MQTIHSCCQRTGTIQPCNYGSVSCRNASGSSDCLPTRQKFEPLTVTHAMPLSMPRGDATRPSSTNENRSSAPITLPDNSHRIAHSPYARFHTETSCGEGSVASAVRTPHWRSAPAQNMMMNFKIAIRQETTRLFGPGPGPFLSEWRPQLMTMRAVRQKPKPENR